MMKRAKGERRYLQPCDLPLGAELLELQRPRRTFALRHEQPNTLVFQASRGVSEDPRRGRVEPLDIVDRDQNGGRARKRLNYAKRGDRSFARPHGDARIRLASEERDFERVPLRRRQRLEHRIVHLGEQIDDCAERETRL